MPRLNKEEDRVEKIIRGLLKLPENKRCINCNSLGPQYVCTNFWTFICTNCSGVHREFTHRVKSVSMATFSMEEAKALQAGGNEKAREIYFKTFDTHRNAIPEDSDHHRVRGFIKRVYVDRIYAGDEGVIDQGSDKLALVKKDVVDDFKNKHSGDENSGHNSCEISNRKSREVSRHELSERPGRSARDAFLELFSNGPFSERPKEPTRDNVSPYSSERSHRGAREDFLGRPSPERKGIGRSDFLDSHSFDSPSKGVRDDFLERHSSEKFTRGGRDGFPEHSSSKSSPSNKREDMNSRNYIEAGRSFSLKQEDTKSGSQKSRKPQFEIVDDRFRDDDTGSVRYLNTRNNVGNASPDSQIRRDIRIPLAICPPPLPSQKEEDDSKPETASTIDVDEGEKKAPISTIKEVSDTQNVTPLDLLLIEWPEASNTKTEDSTSTMPNPAGSIPSDSTSHNQRPTDLSVQTIEASPDNKKDLSSHVQQGVEISGINESQSSRRKEIHVDLFAGGYASFQGRAPGPGWQLHPHHVMGYGMQYQPQVPMCTLPFTNSATSRNPFDIGGDGTQIAAQPFSHIPSLQLAQPNMIVPSGYHNNQESARAFSWQSQHYPFGGASAPAGAFQGQEVPYDSMDNRNQYGQISNNGDAFDSLNPARHLSRTHSTPNTSSYSSTGGNPFG